MNIWFAAGAALTGTTVFLHVFGGGPEVHIPMLESDMSTVLKAFASVLWHAVTVVLIVNCAALIAASKYNIKPIAWVVAAQHFGFVLLFIGYGVTRLNDLMPMPQWIIFLVLICVTLPGFRAKAE